MVLALCTGILLVNEEANSALQLFNLRYYICCSEQIIHSSEYLLLKIFDAQNVPSSENP
jgi:hypothetical protein